MTTRRQATARSVLAVTLAALLFALPAAAHRQTPAGSTEGLPIPSVTHGQMVVLARHRAAILDLADRQDAPDRALLQLRSFVSLQFFACLWGLVPGSLASETSPFNECTHAYLAGTRALLLHLQTMQDHAAASALRRTLDVEMLANNAAMILCQFSEEPFNTADVIFPTWTMLPDDPLSAATFVGLAAAIVACGAAGWAIRRHRIASARGFSR